MPATPAQGRGLVGRRLPAEPGRPAQVQWSGWIRVPTDGEYLLAPATPDLRLRVLGRDWPRGGATVHLAAGRFHAVQITGPAPRHAISAPLLWKPPAGIRAAVPDQHLFPSEHLASAHAAVGR
jgi:hypothetical protein